ncbi:Mu-like prophage major head subunit gpT family protein [Pararhodobacter zhoushanensis]|uniref:Mu-like prophage major head subunit gpT family protein n=1 Tax=Pararhodobacter zhoushanensis TaxID=2479545 RepID=A0ABT3GW21_9RHOB|nr:Mu-like prophage major head subunit gpT family protein [Pararhodobacter zhoushanensis]MCW1931730.1 Mu-like prophage major head subunit gpT family protein [Pararhodobacter zhoushanensis]
MLDFQMKHEGEPPAQLLAQVQMLLGKAEIPKWVARQLTPYMSTADDLDAKLIEELQALIALFSMHNMTLEEMKAALLQAIEDNQADRGDSGGDPDAEKTEMSASLLLRHAIARLRSKGPKMGGATGPCITRWQSPLHQNVAMFTDALQARLDRNHTPTTGRRFASHSLAEMAMAFERANGNRPFNMHEAVRMATHATSDFPSVLSGALGNLVARDVLAAKPALMRAAHEVEATDYRLGNMLGLSASGMPQEVGEGGEIKHVTIDESGEAKPAPRDFAALFRISQKALINDDLGLFGQIAKKMVAGAIERQRHVLLEPLLANAGLGNTMSDGKTVFHAAHGNLASSGAALSVASLSAARLALRTQRGKQGEYFAIEPWALVVPPALETAAQQVLAQINATKSSDTNPFAGSLEIIVEVGLTDAKAWYLIGNPATSDGLAYSFLDGQSAPRVESKPGWETLGTEFRLVWALDARFVSWASWFKNPGA